MYILVLKKYGWIIFSVYFFNILIQIYSVTQTFQELKNIIMLSSPLKQCANVKYV